MAVSSQCLPLTGRVGLGVGLRGGSSPPPKVFYSQRLIVCKCQKREGDEGLIDRRVALTLGLSFGGSVWGSGVWGGFLCTESENANAADITQRFQRVAFLTKVKDKLRDVVKDNRKLIPDLLKLALNDAVSYDKASKTGGPNGSIRFSEELARPENRGLDRALNVLGDLKKEIDAETKGGPISWADLIQIAAQSAVKRTFIEAAVRKCGGNEEKGLQLYGAYGSAGQWAQFDKQLGRSDAEESDPAGRVLIWQDASTVQIKERFEQLGLSPRYVTVLSAFLGPSQAEVEDKLNAYPDFAPWVKKYRASRETVSQTDYEVDLITTFTKLSTLGQTINYERYSYAVPAVRLKF